MVLELAEKNGGEATSSDVMNLLGLSYISAYRLLKKMEDEGKLKHEGKGRSLVIFHRINRMCQHLKMTPPANGREAIFKKTS